MFNPFKDYPLAKKQELWQAHQDPRLRYTPQAYQMELHQTMWPDVVGIFGGVGAAKTYSIGQHIAHELGAAKLRAEMYGIAPDGYTGRIALTGKGYEPAPRVLFNYLKQRWDSVGGVEWSSTPSKGQWKMKSVTGVEVLTVSASDTAAFASLPYTVVAMTEAMQQEESMFRMAVERVSRWPCSNPDAPEDATQGIVVFEGTFEENQNQWFAELARHLKTPGNPFNGIGFEFASWLNEYTYRGGFANAKIQRLLAIYRAMGQEDLFYERIGGQPPKPKGSLFADYFDRDKHVSDKVTFNTKEPVDWALDPATHRMAGLFIQWPDDRTCHIVDELVVPRASFNKYKKEWEEKGRYEYGKPYAENIVSGQSTATVDIAGNQHHQGMDSTYDLWRAPKPAGMGLNLQYRPLTKDAGFNVMVRALLGMDYEFKIHPRCLGLIHDLETEKRGPDGSIDDRLNKGHDDARKAASYYLAIKKGWTAAQTNPLSEEELLAAAGWGPMEQGIHVPKKPRGIFG